MALVVPAPAVPREPVAPVLARPFQAQLPEPAPVVRARLVLVALLPGPEPVVQARLPVDLVVPVVPAPLPLAVVVAASAAARLPSHR